MVSAIFSTEISTLESQVAALQAKIAQLQTQAVQLQSRKTALGEADLIASGILQAVQDGVRQISGLAPDAIATLKSAVFALFNSGDDGSGGLPIPSTSQPNLGGDSGLDGSSSPWASHLCELLEDAPATSLLGQSFELAGFFGHHDLLCEGQLLDPPGHCWYEGSDDRGLPTRLVSPQFSQMACLLEDCPEESLKGQSVEITCSVSFEDEPTEPKYVDLVRVTDNVAYMRRCGGEIISVYAGGSNKGKLRNWGDWLTRTHSVTQGYEIREGKRLGTKWELKLTSMTLAQIERLALCDFSKDPRTNYPDAPKRPVERVPGMVEIEGIGVGDTVRSITVKHWQYKVMGIDSDNFLVCDLAEPDICSADRLNTNPTITQVLHPGSVELVSKADAVDLAKQELEQYLEQQAQAIAPTPTIDPTDVPRGVTLRQTNDDFIVEYLVYGWVVVRNQGKPEPYQNCFGRLVEGLGIIEAYKPVSGRHKAFSSTREAIDFLVNTSNYRFDDINVGIELYESRQQQRLLAGVGALTHQLEDAEF